MNKGSGKVWPLKGCPKVFAAAFSRKTASFKNCHIGLYDTHGQSPCHFSGQANIDVSPGAPATSLNQQFVDRLPGRR